MAMRVIDLTGERFERLTVVSRAENDKRGKARWHVRCSCGSPERIVHASALRRGSSISCGCWQREAAGIRFRTHGYRNNPLYRIWHHMIRRCSDDRNPQWSNYGVRGVPVCDRWLALTAFIAHRRLEMAS